MQLAMPTPATPGHSMQYLRPHFTGPAGPVTVPRTPRVRPRSARPLSQTIIQAPLDDTDDRDPNLPRRPYPNSYWATPTLLGSEYPAKATQEESIARLETLMDLGVLDYIDLTDPQGGEPLPGQKYDTTLAWVASKRGYTTLRMVGTVNKVQTSKYTASADWQATPNPGTIRYANFPIRDTTVPDGWTLQSIMSALYYSTRQGRRAIVHCNGGYGRTGTIIGCWLVFNRYVRDTIQNIPNQYTVVRTPQGALQKVPVATQKRAGEYALEVLAKKWRGVEKSRVAPYTPGNSMQMDFVKAFRPPVQLATNVTAQQQNVQAQTKAMAFNTGRR